jgi:polysaccharide chain length determinant protein (PEP-CTERM system associated)
VNQTYGQLIDWINAVWKRRWRALVVAWCVCLVGWTFVVSKPDVYTSRTRIFVNTASILKPLLKGLAVEQDVKTEFEVVKQTLTTRANLEKVARMTDLDLFATTPEQMQRLLDGLRSRTTIQTDGRALLSISYSDRDPLLARDVVQALSKVFIETNLGASREEIEEAQHFLDRQIAQYERTLEAAEARLAKFREERLSVLPDQQNYQFRVDEIRNDLEETLVTLQRVRSRGEQLRQQLQRGPVSDTAAQIFEAEQQLTDLSTRYKERHPDVLALRRKIAALKEIETERRGPFAAEKPDATSLEGAVSPEDYERIKFALGQAEADIAVHRGRASRLRSRLARLEALAAKVPDTEVQLAKLNRDYDVVKVKHSELLARREQAKISRDRKAGAERIQYDILDPPRVPAIPDGPSRSIMISAVLLAALGAGIGFAIVISYLNTSFSDPSRLQAVFGMTVLGTVSVVQSVRRQTWQITKLATFAGSFGLLFAAYGTIMVTESRVGWKNIVPARLVQDLIDRALALTDLI